MGSLVDLATLPDEEDETLGGLLTKEDLLQEINYRCDKYTPAQRIQAATVWTVTGNDREVERQTGIPRHAIIYWRRKSPWWKELVRQVRKAKQDELDAMLTGIIFKGVEQIADRIENGNPKRSITEDGRVLEYTVPLSAGELATATLAIPYDKRALLRGDPTARTERSSQDEIQESLAKLANTFESFAKRIAPQYKEPETIDAEFTEVESNVETEERL